jgi:hypothetical protein
MNASRLILTGRCQKACPQPFQERVCAGRPAKDGLIDVKREKAAGESMPRSKVLAGPASPQACGLRAWVDDSSILVQTGLRWESNYETVPLLASAGEGWFLQARAGPSQTPPVAISPAA